MFNGVLLEVDRFKKLMRCLERLMSEVMLKVDKDKMYTSTLILGGAGYLLFEFKNNCFKEYSIDSDITTIIQIVGLNKIARMLNQTDFGIKIRVTNDEIKFYSADTSLNFEYSQKFIDEKVTTLEYYDESKLPSKTPDVVMIIDSSVLKRVLDNVKVFGALSIKFNWDSNGVYVTCGEREIIKFSVWFKKEGITFENLIGAGNAEFPVSQLEPIFSFLDGEKVHVTILGDTSPIIIGNIDKTKFRFRCMIAPYSKLDSGV